MNFSVTRYGRKLDYDLYILDEINRTFFTKENGLVLDFANVPNFDFVVGDYCTLIVSNGCSFRAGSNCVVVRRGTFEIVLPKEGEKIKFNGFLQKGYKIIKDTKTIIIDGKEIEISLESYNKLKEQFK